MSQLIVIGSGIIGLSSAIRLLENGFSVKIISREMPQDTISSVAGAIWAGYGLEGQERLWSRKALKVFQEQAKDAESGVLISRYHEVFPYPIDDAWYQDELPFYARIEKSQLPQGFLDGYISDTPLVQTPKYLAYLLKRFEELGGTIEKREIKSLSELSEYPLIINCTGVYARHVAQDEAVHPIWGQVLLADAPHITESFMDDETFTYLYPRKDGVVLGGIHVHERWERKIDDAVTADIIARCQKLVPELGEVKIIKTLVGLRPGRHEVRLEKEQLSDTCTVIHNYGHRGIGYTLSWGCAEDVLALVKEI